MRSLNINIKGKFVADGAAPTSFCSSVAFKFRVIFNSSIIFAAFLLLVFLLITFFVMVEHKDTNFLPLMSMVSYITSCLINVCYADLGA